MMSSTLSSRLINSARSSICAFHGKGHLNSRYISNEKKVNQRRLLSKSLFSSAGANTSGSKDGVLTLSKAFRHTSTEEEDFSFHLTPSQIDDILRAKEIEFAMESLKPVLPILQWYKHPNDRFFQEVASLYLEQLRVYWQALLDMDSGFTTEEALVYAFKRLDSDLSLEVQAPIENELMRNIALQVAFSGSTACVAHVNNIHLHVANAGDCRAVLGVQNEDGSWSALPLTRDHNASNKSEVLRLRREHPKSEEDTLLVNDRLLGVLMPSRAFGDVQFKWSQELQHNVLGNRDETKALNIYEYVPPNYHTPPYLTAEPEVTYHKIRRQDKFLVIASDGLWDMLSNEEVVKLVAEHLLETKMQKMRLAFKKTAKRGYMQNLLLQRKAKRVHSYDGNVATHLIRHAVGNNEYGEVDQERLVAMLTLPDDLARMYRDDITVTVVHFNSETVDSYYQENK
ncbi:pyruvate dehydrogenase [acetyl-transferring]-phosphatase 2, mitochondrial isoform X3 [Eublepharis macularius]|uniref:Pyruvate dehydrogenase [acetyl-transferring]-phosphatase 2, mitochondrial isoform X3 n=1 Tax=Eublepharis macularius TaxID=481883 RepID=A0AA97LLI8_EUBMA|nr:pyruvate dehydrogenase [acetyl-transferring]-phosphatase 2, mitochondrial isoform X3 [Eublepharis macularius]